MRRAITAACFVGAIAGAPAAASAFCGFYVEGSGKELYNDATQVVLMREGTRTVLSMQNHYEGPAESFAMVIPVSTVLHEGDVKTLSRDVLAKLEVMDAPRLVEYWERDPCAPDEHPDPSVRRKGEKKTMAGSGAAPKPDDLGVTIEAQFEVGEYQIVILSATDSTGLDTWLAREKYAIPKGAEPLLRPYVEGGWKFFVAKVDPKKVTFDGDRALLSPLRFHYDADEFVLPVRLGLINSSGTQDLIVHILARGQRYEVENYPSVFIPTNLDLKEDAADRFAEFYAALYDRTIEQHPGAVVTEYAWQAMGCDPCPGPTLTSQDLQTLGGDVLDGKGGAGAGFGAFVLTRLHARYGKELKDDLVFRATAAVTGGREVRDATGALEEGSQAASHNNFQARYAIRHPWTGPIACTNPVHGRWGGPPSGTSYAGPKAGRDLAFAPRGQVQLAQLVIGGVPELKVAAAGGGPAPDPAEAPATAKPPAPAPEPATAKTKQGCGCQSGSGAASAWLVLGLAALLRRRSKRGGE